jgi:hypothetical protein
MKTVFKRFLLPAIYGAIVALLLLVPVQLCAPTYAAEAEAECWAVIVGISDYQNYDDLTYADDDAEELASQLGAIWGVDHVKLLTDSMATRQGIENEITDWLALSEDINDTVIFFFSGRGDYDHLYPCNSLTTSYSNDIFPDDLDSWLNTLNSQKIAVIFDLCLSDSFLNRLTKTGRVILTAGSSDESAFENSTLRHGVFAYYVLEALGEFEAADNNSNFELSVEEVFDYAATRTTNYTASDPDLTAQHPQISDNYGGQLSLLVKVTADVGPDLPQDISLLNIDGKMYSPAELPVSFIWAPGSGHDFQAVSSVSGGNGIQYVFDSWDDGNTSDSRAISSGGTYIANYTTRYYLTVESDYGQPEGEGWYIAGSMATISVASSEGAIIRQVFIGWSGDCSATTASASVIMDVPRTVVANWKTDYMQLYLIIGGGIIVVGALIAVLMIRRRKKAVAPARVERIPQPPTTKYCKNCGAEIKPGDAFCTKCGEAVKE